MPLSQIIGASNNEIIRWLIPQADQNEQLDRALEYLLTGNRRAAMDLIEEEMT